MKVYTWINIWIIAIITWTFMLGSTVYVAENYVSPQKVRLNGKIYVCGTFTTTKDENLDDESLYCRGYREGYNWANTQIEMDSNPTTQG